MNNNALTVRESGFRLTLKSKMTYQFASEIEDMILDAMRHYVHVEVDLSKVQEIDLCGAGGGSHAGQSATVCSGPATSISVSAWRDLRNCWFGLIMILPAAVKQAYEHFLSRTVALTKVKTMSAVNTKKSYPGPRHLEVHQVQCAA